VHRHVAELGDDTFQAELAGVFAEAGAIACDVFAIAQTADLLLEQALELGRVLISPYPYPEADRSKQ